MHPLHYTKSETCNDENVSHVQQYDYAFDIRLWNVTGGVDGLVCKSVNSSSEDMLCKELSIPACADRTVYCTFPPEVNPPAVLTILQNPSPFYRRSDCK